MADKKFNRKTVRRDHRTSGPHQSRYAKGQMLGVEYTQALEFLWLVWTSIVRRRGRRLFPAEQLRVDELQRKIFPSCRNECSPAVLDTAPFVDYSNGFNVKETPHVKSCASRPKDRQP